MRAALLVFSLIAVIGTVLSRYIDIFVKPGAPSAMTVTAAPAAPPAMVGGPRIVTLQSDGRGHFKVDARIDGRRIDVLVDTGASTIALRESAAAMLGIHPKASDYTAIVRTANGVARIAPIRLNRVEVNGITVRDVEAAVMPDELLGQNLLGMTFLSRVKWTHERGRLTLEQ